MCISDIVYKINCAKQNDIYNHLKACDSNFTPPLSTKLNIQDYAIKIYDNAVTFEAWFYDVLVGLIAVYFNDKNNVMGYITNVSIIKNYMGLGIAGELMKASIEYAQQNGFDEITLEVCSANDAAIKLYRKFGFEVFGAKDDFLRMKLKSIKDRTIDNRQNACMDQISES